MNLKQFVHFLGLTVLLAAQYQVCQAGVPRPLPLLEKSGLRAYDVNISPHIQASLSKVRGGAFEPKLVAATAGASILALYGPACMLSPEKVCQDAYGLSLANEPAVISHIVRNSGLLTCTGNVAIWCLAYGLTSTNKAMGIAFIPYALRSLQNLLNKSPDKFDLSIIAEYSSLFLSSWAAYATLSNAPFATDAVKAIGAGMILRGLYLFAYPHTMVAGQNKENPDFLTMNCRNFGNNLVINGVFFAAIGMGFDVFKSFGYCWWYAAAGMAMMNFGTKDIPKLAPTVVAPTTIWVVLCAVLGTIMAS